MSEPINIGGIKFGGPEKPEQKSSAESGEKKPKPHKPEKQESEGKKPPKQDSKKSTTQSDKPKREPKKGPKKASDVIKKEHCRFLLRTLFPNRALFNSDYSLSDRVAVLAEIRSLKERNLWAEKIDRELLQAFRSEYSRPNKGLRCPYRALTNLSGRLHKTVYEILQQELNKYLSEFELQTKAESKREAQSLPSEPTEDVSDLLDLSDLLVKPPKPWWKLW